MKSYITSPGTRIQLIAGGRSNVFLVSAARYRLLVDTGPRYKGSQLIGVLQKEAGGRMDGLLLTHTHFDHAGNARLVKDTFGCEVFVHQSEEAFLLSGDCPLPAGTNAFTKLLINAFGKAASRQVRYPSCKAETNINEQFSFIDKGLNAIALHTPGHTAGSLSLVVDQEIALTGDILFGIFPGNCFPPFGDNISQLADSWQMLLSTGAALFLPSHGWPVSRNTLEKNLKKLKRQIH